MNKFQKNFSWKTWLRYFLSYFLIFTILILGFFFIIRNQLTRRYFTQLCEQSENQLENLAGQMSDDFVFLSQIDHSMATNIQLILSRYSPESWQNYEAYRELGKYISSNKLIDAICYMPKNFNNVISTRYSIFYENGTFLIRNDNNVSLTFDPTPYYDAASGQLIYLSNGAAEYLIYFPAISSGRNYVFFYILETDDILQRMNTLVSDTMPAIALMDENKQLVAGVNSEALLPYLDSLELTDGTARIDSSSLCVRTEIRNGFSVIAMISNDSLSQQINSAFASTYLSLFLLGSIGFLLVFFAMRITYRPLRELTQKIVSDPAANQGYLEQLDDAFSQTAYGDEAAVRIHKYEELFETGNAIYAELPEKERDAFFELALMRIHAAYFTNLAYYYGDRSTLACRQGKSAAAAEYVRRCREMDDARRKMLVYYNTRMAQGKWDGILDPEGFPPPRAAMLPACTPPLPEEMRARRGTGTKESAGETPTEYRRRQRGRCR